MSGGLTRRNLMIGVVVAGAGGMLFGGPPALANSAVRRGAARHDMGALSPSPSRILRRSTFVPLVGQPFGVSRESARLSTVVLDSVRDLSPVTRGKQGQFALRFRETRSGSFPQSMYEFSHRWLGTFELFVVPMPPASGPGYEAVVNRV
jgi:hypothetical protein